MRKMWAEVLRLIAPLLRVLGLQGVAEAEPLLGRPLSPAQRRLPAFLGGLSDAERKAEAFGIETRVLTIGGLRRRFHLLVPAGWATGAAPPMVLALHGGGGNALSFVRKIGARRLANEHGFVVVAPQGHGRPWSRHGSWNADSVVRLGLAERLRVDDVRFLEAVIRSVEVEAGADPDRAYVMGASKGGMMAYRLACARPDCVAAIAVVAGTLSTDRCPKGARVPLLHIHGSRDENVPPEGGRGRHSAPGADWPPVARGIDLFRRANGCTGKPEDVRVAPDTICRVYRSEDGGEVRFCLVEGGGHAWPGVAPTARQARRGLAASQFDATEYIARFFLAH